MEGLGCPQSGSGLGDCPLWRKWEIFWLCSFPRRTWQGGAELTLGIGRQFLAKKVVRPWKGFLERGFSAVP